MPHISLKKMERFTSASKYRNSNQEPEYASAVDLNGREEKSLLFR